MRVRELTFSDVQELARQNKITTQILEAFIQKKLGLASNNYRAPSIFDIIPMKKPEERTVRQSMNEEEPEQQETSTVEDTDVNEESDADDSKFEDLKEYSEYDGLQKQFSKNAKDGKEDEVRIYSLLCNVVQNCPKPIKIFRKGKFAAGKNHKIKICFETHEPAKALLRNKTQFPENIKVYSDQTPWQVKFYNEIKNELSVRQGEKDLTIKYIKESLQ
ncbi:unnamed protein product [Leptidea sinapis]|uniref:Uncharacterized protein n=1 Tax=Leptidea sinapis TaxID=189913 RepID=A0A5E4QZ10_9NEOP|nr:unnamed protein product [Leptidea sinapis]